MSQAPTPLVRTRPESLSAASSAARTLASFSHSPASAVPLAKIATYLVAAALVATLSKLAAASASQSLRLKRR